jgi:chromosome partitioning protein
MFICRNQQNKKSVFVQILKIIAILNQKGGCGKTTLSINITHSVQEKGYQALLIDNDPQGSARDWNALNDRQIIPVIGIDRSPLANDIRSIKSFEYVVIDGAPGLIQNTIAAVKIADFVLIPVMPSPQDLWATEDITAIAKEWREIKGGKPDAAFVVNRVNPATKIYKETIESLKDMGLLVLDSFTSNKVIYSEVISKGETLYCNLNKTREEIDNIRNEMIKILHKL